MITVYGWALILLTLLLTVGCFIGLGVGANAFLQLLLTTAFMTAISGLIAWGFLRKRTRS